ncbi:uncharacterized protein [Paramormyrops kingsleyae]|uniref:uncharacterized protein n=1 Tax=Paramormyrops kingsleyae TaxID=1676925 RepID=UPI000CD64407|nr:uncharacterized protein LOC111837938 isoform X3 [Paramormyrops kingsleyae]XP_023656186.1 uncharacterized protein LOC111837938 isoform X3 [Paramormyrops kingsleyae]
MTQRFNCSQVDHNVLGLAPPVRVKGHTDSYDHQGQSVASERVGLEESYSVGQASDRRWTCCFVSFARALFTATPKSLTGTPQPPAEVVICLRPTESPPALKQRDPSPVVPGQTSRSSRGGSAPQVPVGRGLAKPTAGLAFASPRPCCRPSFSRPCNVIHASLKLPGAGVKFWSIRPLVQAAATAEGYRVSNLRRYQPTGPSLLPMQSSILDPSFHCETSTGALLIVRNGMDTG